MDVFQVKRRSARTAKDVFDRIHLHGTIKRLDKISATVGELLNNQEVLLRHMKDSSYYILEQLDEITSRLPGSRKDDSPFDECGDGGDGDDDVKITGFVTQKKKEVILEKPSCDDTKLTGFTKKRIHIKSDV